MIGKSLRPGRPEDFLLEKGELDHPAGSNSVEVARIDLYHGP
jgi:hypothetical protein